MMSLKSIILLPPALLALLAEAELSSQPTAIKKLSPDANEKIFPEHLAFAPAFNVPVDIDGTPLLRSIDERDDELDRNNGSVRFYERAFAPHFDETKESMLRRAAEVLDILKKRSSCPSDMTSCEDIGMANKCCQKGTYCTKVSDTNVGQVACCPNGSECGGGVGNCPSSAVSCPVSLGGGCCLSGYVCQGVGCVIEGATQTQTEVRTTTENPSSETITKTQTTIVAGQPTTVVVTLTVTRTGSSEPTTKTTTVTASETETDTNTATGGAPWRPTGTSEDTATGTQTGCPTGFYGCLATHGGGCCQTDRECETKSCPAPTSSTLISNGVTVVVPAVDVTSTATATCADGWFMCGTEGGPVAGCCPTGYNCGTASCFTTEASQTGSVQKELPDNSASSPQLWGLFLLSFTGVAAAVLVL